MIPESTFRYLQGAYKYILTRGAIWRRSSDGRMYSDYCSTAPLEFLAKFPASTQRQIAGKSLEEMKKDCRSSKVEKALEKLSKVEIEDLLMRLKEVK